MKGRDVFGRILVALSNTKHRGSGNIGIATMDKSICGKSVEELDKACLSGDIGIGVIWNGGKKRFSRINDSVYGVLDGRLHESERPKKKSLKDKSETRSDTEILIQLLKIGITRQQGLSRYERLISQKLRTVNGVFAFAILHKNRIFIARDMIGIKPLYIGKDEDTIAFCSEKKGLWSIGFKKGIHPLEPGSFSVIDEKGLHVFRKSWTYRIRERKPEKSVEDLELILRKSVRKRVRKCDPVGILFSGGLDSTILAKIAKDFGIDVRLYCAGIRKAKDVVKAKEVSTILDLPLKVETLTPSTIEHDLAGIVYGIETIDFKAIAIGIPVYFASKLARNDGIDTVLSGQGADELFGGYARYESVLEKNGYDELQRILVQDIRNIARLNVQRDEHAAMMNGVEIRLPYLDKDVVKSGLEIPARFKIQKRADQWIRKFVLRKLAVHIGLPKEVSWGSKVAMQYGSGSQRNLEKLARAKGFTKSFAKEHGYTNHVQLFIEFLAKQVGFPMRMDQYDNVLKDLNSS